MLVHRGKSLHVPGLGAWHILQSCGQRALVRLFWLQLELFKTLHIEISTQLVLSALVLVVVSKVLVLVGDEVVEEVHDPQDSGHNVDIIGSFKHVLVST